ncbi:TonB-dependent receptor [Flavobacterium macacae]|uniref:TonB-dependent receptor n=1 Tax=Flavobacterium macacae TaxID=2488993 RepID=A0A3P3WHG9_9FLAO|nr:TonB-dependent receptor [Flavobacterium macacae]RRJ93656.1 TonB-dependent receptor [Flavobacterium macacae]
MKKYYLLFIILFTSNLFAQNDSIQKTKTLNEVFISSFHINDSLQNAPASIGIISKKELQANNNTDISTAINRISGVYMQSANLTTNRISIRGIGARTPYGTNKIRAFYGNIPLTSGNSETTIDDIDLENINQVEIIKGPLSSIYGAGLGGAILISPKKSENTASISTTHGSFGLVKNTVSLGLDSETSSLNLSYHNLETDGWRDNSSYNREGITLAGELFRKKNSKLTYFSNYTYLKAFIPSSINKEAFDNDPEAGAPTWVASKGFKEYKSVLGGLAYDFKISDKITSATSVFVNYKDNNEPRPFDILRQYTFASGARTQFNGAISVGKTKALWNLGLEYFRDNYAGKTLENLYQENNGNGSLEGNKLTETNQERDFYNAFAQLQILLSKKFELQAGLNFNKTQFNLETLFPIENASSENYSYDAIWSPQISFLFKPNHFQTVYFSASRGFSLPTIEETLTENGTINPNIKPENGYNFEIGGKFYFLNRNLYTEISAYRMQINDLLVAQRVGDDQYVGINAGETLHQGIEFSANYNLTLNKIFALNTFISTSIGKYEFKEFIDKENNFSRNKLTGVPSNKVNAGIALNTDFGFYLAADYQFADEIPLNDANSATSDAYKITNLKTGCRFQIFKNFTSHISTGVNNLFDEKYASMVLVNATAFGNASPRYYYPGLPVNFYGNISFAYSF